MRNACKIFVLKPVIRDDFRELVVAGGKITRNKSSENRM
jgi:hypothetical protein